MSNYSDQIRKEWAVNDAKRDAKYTTPLDIQRWDNIAYGQDQKWNLLDVYEPKNFTSEKLPVIIIVHGGAWVYGKKEIYQFYGMELAQHGFAVVNYNYRLAPENKFPSAIEDAANVIDWIFANQENFGFDTKHIFLAGDSAGAHMAVLIAEIVSNGEYAQQFPTVKFHQDFLPKALLLNCGAYQLFNGQGEYDAETNPELMDDLLSAKDLQLQKHLVNVIDHINAEFPPAYIMTCEGDFLRRQSGLLVKKLEQFHVPFVYRMFGSPKDPLYHVFHVTISDPHARACTNDECAYLKEFCDD